MPLDFEVLLGDWCKSLSAGIEMGVISLGVESEVYECRVGLVGEKEHTCKW